MLTSGWLDALGRDLKFTRRVLTKNFAFTATAIVTLALGIAASTVIYSVVDAVLLKPLDYNDSGDIYRVYTVDTVGLPRGTTGPPHIDPMAEEGAVDSGRVLRLLLRAVRGQRRGHGVRASTNSEPRRSFSRSSPSH